jgi:hypothetical protein
VGTINANGQELPARVLQRCHFNLVPPPSQAPSQALKTNSRDLPVSGADGVPLSVRGDRRRHLHGLARRVRKARRPAEGAMRSACVSICQRTMNPVDRGRGLHIAASFFSPGITTSFHVLNCSPNPPPYSDERVANRNATRATEIMDLERWTNPKLSRCTCSPPYRLQSWRGKSAA